MKRLFWLLLPIAFFLFAQAFTLPEPDRPVPVTTELAAPLAVVVSAGSNSPLCAGATLGLTATVTSGTAPFSFAWSGPGGFSSNSQNPSRANITTAQAGVYGVTVTDGTGATSSASVMVEVYQAPTANAGKDQILCKNKQANLSGTVGGSASSGSWAASANGGTFLPNPNTLNAVYSPPNNYVGKIILTLTTNDPNGPCTPVSDQLELTYGDPDAMVCNDLVEVSMDDDCSVTIYPDMALEGDVLDSLFKIDIFTLQGINIGNTITSKYVGIPLKIKVTDKCSGNSCTTDVSVKDVLPPVFLNCLDIKIPCAIKQYDPAYLDDVLGIEQGYPEVTDNCSGVTLTYFDTWGDVPCGTTFNGQQNLSAYVKRIWNAVDGFGNKATCTQFIYFERIGIYDLSLPTDVTVSCDKMLTDPMAAGTPYYTAFGIKWPLIGSNTFCEINATPTDQIITVCSGTYSIIRTWTIFDLCLPSSSTPPSNPLTHVQLINVVDQQGPAIACPPNLTVSTNLLSCCSTTDLPDVIMDDACGRVQDAYALILIIDPFTGDTVDQVNIKTSLANFPGNNKNDSDTLAVFGDSPCLPIGKHIVYYYGEDVCGNSSACSFKITVIDSIPPVAACDEFTQVSVGIDGMILVNAKTFDDGSYDNCSSAYFKVRREESNTCQPNNKFYDQVKFCCEDLGDTVTVILRVYDVPLPVGAVDLTYEEKHSNECQVQVLVDDKLKPVCVAPGNVTVTCENFDPSLWAYGMATAADNCCVDTVTATASFAQFDTVCNKGTILRTFRAVDCSGLSSTCSQRVYVTYKQNYSVKFPNDVVVNVCAGVDQFGEPQVFGEDCELLGISYEDHIFTVVPDACYKIERTWTIINWCTYDPNKGCTNVPNPNPSNTLNHPSNLAGPIVSPKGTPSPWAPTVVKVNPSDAETTDFSIFWSADVNCYKYKQIIKISDTQKPTIVCPASPVEACDQTDNSAQLWNESYWYDQNTLSHDLCEAPTDLCVTGTDACSGANVTFRYLLFLDLDGNGTMETVVNSVNPPAPGTVNYNNSGSPNYAGGLVRTFDERNVTAQQKYQFALQTITSGFNKTACLRWNTPADPNNYVLPEFPYGTHKIKWIIQDGCGNEQVCEYTFVVKDCKPPTVTCFNGLSVNMMPQGSVSLDVTFFLQDATDNCTPKNQLVYAVRKAGTGAGFPALPDGSPATTATFDCSELNFQLVEIWARDKAGNGGYCTTFVHVQDNIGACSGPGGATVAGMLQTEHGNGLEEADVHIQCAAPTGQAPLSLFDLSNTDGFYGFNNAIPILCSYTVTPTKDNDPLNGVSTFDLVLINKHILGLQPLNTPYKMIAADVNNSRSITTYDLVELRKLILGVYTELPSNSSWRFVDKEFQFKNPSNPFEDLFPETKSVLNLTSSHMNDDFVAIKVGDVNSNSVANSLMAGEDRSNGEILFDVTPVSGRYDVKTGETFDVTFAAAEEVLAYQFTLNYPGLEVLDIQPGPGLDASNFAVFADEQALTSSFDAPDNHALPTFTVTFRAQKAGQISQMLGLSSRITKAMAYKQLVETDELTNDEVSKYDVALRYQKDGTPAISTIGFELYQNTPNPWVQKTQISFHLPVASEATLTVYDEMSRTVFTKTAEFSKGYNTVFIDRTLLDAPGMMYYTLETPFGKATKRMIQTR